MKYCIDKAYVKDAYMNVIGWAAGSSGRAELRFLVTDGRGKTVNAEIYRNQRPDIGMALFHDPAEKDFGVFIKFPCKGNELYTFHYQEIENGAVKDQAVFKLNPALIRARMLYKEGKAALKGPREKIKFVMGKLTHKDKKVYQQWFAANRVTEEKLAEQRKNQPAGPKFSILVPVYKTPIPYLTEMIDSVLAQSYWNWELCLANADTSSAELNALLAEKAKQDSRILVKTLEKNLGIAGNTNAALTMASGEYIGLLDHDDLLEPDALYEYAAAVAAEPETDVIYCDEDKITENSTDYFFPNFKPDFDPDFLRGNNYICHFLAVRKRLAEEAGGFRDEFNGAQDYDFVLRCTEKTGMIRHIPRVLYHWRSIQGSTAQGHENKSYASDAGARAINAHYARLGIPAEAAPAEVGGWYRSVYSWEKEPLVSVLIPTKDHTDDLEKCLKSLYEVNTYRNFEVIVIENNSTDPKTFDYYKAAEKKYPRLQVVTWKTEAGKAAFNYAAINNFGASHAAGEYLLLLNNDTEVITPDFLKSMLGFGQRPDTGIVGAKLLYPDDTVQHAGVLLGAGGMAGHMFIGKKDSDPCYMCRAITSIDLSAVTAACMLVRTSVYREVGGIDERFEVAFNDVDFCLKVRKAGYLVVYDADAKLHHYESKSRGTEDTPEKFMRAGREHALLNEKWKIQRSDAENGFFDPYYNPNFSYEEYFTPNV